MMHQTHALTTPPADRRPLPVASRASNSNPTVCKARHQVGCSQFSMQGLTYLGSTKAGLYRKHLHAQQLKLYNFAGCLAQQALRADKCRGDSSASVLPVVRHEGCGLGKAERDPPKADKNGRALISQHKAHDCCTSGLACSHATDDPRCTVVHRGLKLHCCSTLYFKRQGLSQASRLPNCFNQWCRAHIPLTLQCEGRLVKYSVQDLQLHIPWTPCPLVPLHGLVANEPQHGHG